MAIYHPEFDWALNDARNRLALGRRLKELADRHYGLGDAALMGSDWEGADLNWRLGSRYMRSSQAISYAKPTDREDWPLIGTAWLEIRADKEHQR